MDAPTRWGIGYNGSPRWRSLTGSIIEGKLAPELAPDREGLDGNEWDKETVGLVETREKQDCSTQSGISQNVS
jgi:hypothetical protein